MGITSKYIYPLAEMYDSTDARNAPQRVMVKSDSIVILPLHKESTVLIINDFPSNAITITVDSSMIVLTILYMFSGISLCRLMAVPNIMICAVITADMPKRIPSVGGIEVSDPGLEFAVT
jgi:hypothetical protein